MDWINSHPFPFPNTYRQHYFPSPKVKSWKRQNSAQNSSWQIIFFRGKFYFRNFTVQTLTWKNAKRKKKIFGNTIHTYINTLTGLCESYFSKFPFIWDTWYTLKSIQPIQESSSKSSCTFSLQKVGDREQIFAMRYETP